MRHLIKKHRVHEVFIAIPEATNKVVKEIMDAAKTPEWGSQVQDRAVHPRYHER